MGSCDQSLAALAFLYENLSQLQLYYDLTRITDQWQKTLFMTTQNFDTQHYKDIMQKETQFFFSENLF